MKIGLVIPWFGRDIPGGAEHLCWELAYNLNKRQIPIEVLTTCVKEFQSNWNHNFYQEGCYQEDGLTVRRFKVRSGDRRVFDAINYKLMQGKKVSLQEELLFMKEIINSPNLYHYLYSHKQEYYFFFIPYMFGTSYWGSKICPEHSFLIPCLHDEGYARMEIIREMFQQVKGILFNSRPEYELAHRLYNLERVNTVVLGVGMDLSIEGNAARFRQKYQLEGDFILYVGRKDPTKGTDQLLEYFCHYLAQTRNKQDLKLILIGKGSISVPRGLETRIIDLGYLPQQDKYDAYTAAISLWQPSINESFSYVLMEAWLCHTPVLVNGHCAVTRDHCLLSQGGLYYRNYFEFEESLNYLVNDMELRQNLAIRGRRYVQANHSWDTIIRRFQNEVLTWV
jgi:glycosyltransferase involved in cell wall biosynthesis